MRARGGVFVVTVLALGLIPGCGGEDPAAPDGPPAAALAGDGFDADRAFEDVRAQVDLGPRPAGSPANEKMVRMLADKLEAARVEDVEIQRPHRNVVGVIPGEQPGYVVIGAHHDTKDEPAILGANDGASGVAVILELARALRAPLPGPSIAIALFDAEESRGDRPFEEDGLRGSRQYVAYAAQGGGEGEQGSAPLDQIGAMALFDLVGDCDLQIPLEANSSPRLHALFAEAADGAPFEGESGGVADDHIPFLEAGIEAVDLIDFTFGPGPSPGAFWHTREDTLDKVCPESLDAVGEAALVALPRIGVSG